MQIVFKSYIENIPGKIFDEMSKSSSPEDLEYIDEGSIHNEFPVLTNFDFNKPVPYCGAILQQK